MNKTKIGFLFIYIVAFMCLHFISRLAACRDRKIHSLLRFSFIAILIVFIIFFSLFENEKNTRGTGYYLYPNGDEIISNGYEIGWSDPNDNTVSYNIYYSDNSGSDWYSILNFTSNL